MYIRKVYKQGRYDILSERYNVWLCKGGTCKILKKLSPLEVQLDKPWVHHRHSIQKWGDLLDKTRAAYEHPYEEWYE